MRQHHYPRYQNVTKALSALSKRDKVFIRGIHMCQSHYPPYPNEINPLSGLFKWDKFVIGCVPKSLSALFKCDVNDKTSLSAFYSRYPYRVNSISKLSNWWKCIIRYLTRYMAYPLHLSYSFPIPITLLVISFFLFFLSTPINFWSFIVCRHSFITPLPPPQFRCTYDWSLCACLYAIKTIIGYKFQLIFFFL